MSLWSAPGDVDYWEEQECLPKLVLLRCRDCGAEFPQVVSEVPACWPQCARCFQKAEERAEAVEIVDPRVEPALVPDGSRAVVIAENQDEYRDLPSIRTPCGQVITRWSLSDEERTAIMRGEDIYITLLSHGSINPLFATVGPVNWRGAGR